MGNSTATTRLRRMRTQRRYRDALRLLDQRVWIRRLACDAASGEPLSAEQEP